MNTTSFIWKVKSNLHADVTSLQQNELYEASSNYLIAVTAFPQNAINIHNTISFN
jgi:hypothetical protein